MRCQQCDRPAFYQVGDAGIPLCIHCWSILEETNFRASLMNAAMMNQAADDMDSIMGIGQMAGRIPVAAIAQAFRRGSVYNSINVSNSQIGVINTGDLAKIDAAITMTAGSDADAVGRQLKALAEAIIEAKDVESETKKELIELLQGISEQVVSGRKKSVVSSLLKAVEERAKGLNAIIQLVASLRAGIAQLFGSDLSV
jgi:hypothetical protein